MRDYRVYVVGPDRHFIEKFEFQCADDDQAIERAKQYVDGHDIELWQQGRKVVEFKAAKK